MKAKYGLLAVPALVGLGVVSYLTIAPAVNAAPVPVTSQQAPAGTEVADTPETPGTAEMNKAETDGPNGPNVEQTGQNETKN